MDIFNLVTLEELDDFPEEPQAAFMQFARIASARLSAFESDHDYENRGSEPVENFRFSFMSAIIGAARTYDIEPLAALRIPLRSEFDWQAYRQFRADLDHYLTQILLQTSMQRRRHSVSLGPDAKDRIRSHLNGIRSLLDNSEGLSNSRREKLLAKLAEFEASLEKGRVNLFAISRVVFEILSVSANVVALSESPTLSKLLVNIFTVAAEAKAADDDNRQVPSDEPLKALLPPRPDEPKAPKKREDFSGGGDFDDEIPF